MLQDLDKTFKGFEETNQLVKGLDKFGQQAHAMITSPKSRVAFDISKESPNFQKLFGESSFDQSCLLASRLVEAGTRFVTIELGGWDTHSNNWATLKTRLCPTLDAGLDGPGGDVRERLGGGRLKNMPEDVVALPARGL